MRTLRARLGRGAYVGLTLGAIGFGTLAAFAPAAEAKAAEQACNTGQCNGFCRSTGAQYGFCDDVGCVCVM